MKHGCLIILVLLLSIASGCTQQEVTSTTPSPESALTEIPESQLSIDGYWEGAYSWGGGREKIQVRFETGEEGLEATLDIPGRNMMGVTLFNVSYDSLRVHFEIKEFYGVFDGELKDDTIDGKFVQSDIPGVFTLEREEAGTETQITPLWPGVWSTPKPSVTDTVVQEGDLVLSGDEVREFSNVHLVLKGNLVVCNRASLKATNVILEFPSEYNKQYGIKVQDDAVFQLQNVYIDSGGPWLNIDFTGSSRVSLTGVWGNDPNIPWYTAQDNAQVSIYESTVGITPLVNFTGNISVKDSSLWLELTIPEMGQVDMSLPFGFMSTWHFPSPADSGIDYQIQTEDTWFRMNAVAVAPCAQVTVRDTEAINLMFLVGSTWSGAVVELHDLKSGFVENRTWEADGAVLQVMNTYVNKWYPTAGGNAELIIIDSEVNEMEPWGEARVTIRNSLVSVIHANNEVEVWVYDSFVEFDVVAYDQSVIRLFNTTVHGNLDAVDEGKIYVDGVELES